MIVNLFKRIFLFLFVKDYIKKAASDKWVFISYLSEPFYKKLDETYLNRHQNRRESIIIADCFHQLGFNVHVSRFDKPLIFRRRKYDVVFGLEPNFEKISQANHDAIKIYYATGAYWEFQNKQIVTRTAQASQRFNYPFIRHRMVAPHQSAIIADHIIQIGTPNTIKSYPKEIRHKIHIIRQSITIANDLYQIKTEGSTNKKNFLWFGSGGSILKGLDLLLIIFEKYEEFTLHIVGKMDDDFHSMYSGRKENGNIKYHGYMEITDPCLMSIVNECAFVIFPSASEGMPGSLLNMMYLGLIPITTSICASPEMYKLGAIVDLDLDSIEGGMLRLNQLSDAELIDLSIQNRKYVLENFSLEIFRSDFCNALSTIFVNQKFKDRK
ncbi:MULTISPECIES: glycosyltransferase family 4 protein [Sphingobacterium]|uniref:Glycosyltransferase involved in cell wall biosynthesis n=1 Tax=Sphingobacterium siyangense TaxID=459529 RepID=A0A562MJ25_9SPHI|nr:MULTISPECIES: glycosyltransferase family 4 protein [Sphingobacterium]TWI19937.1 glycosyltransferase involved in cell wall biosynthesis [Sphingobacterium siyangense]